MPGAKGTDIRAHVIPVDQILYGDMVYYDDVLGIAGTTYPIGTVEAPSNTIADVITICAAHNLRTISVHGAMTLGVTMEHYNFIGYSQQEITDILSLNGQDVDGSRIQGLIVTGAQGGTGFVTIDGGVVSAVTLLAGRVRNCSFYVSTCSFRDASFVDLVNCSSVSGVVIITVQAPTRASIKNWTGNLTLTAQDGGLLDVRGFKGSLEIDAMTAGTLNVYANGADITINADCVGGTINIYGSATITDNSVIPCTVNDFTEQDDRAEQTAELLAADMTLVTVFGSGSLSGAAPGEATLCSLDAIGGTKKDVKVTVYLDAATAGNITERWYLTSIAAPVTFVLKLPENAAHAPGAACVLTREFGDVPEGLQLQFRILSAADDSGVDYEVELTYLE